METRFPEKSFSLSMKTAEVWDKHPAAQLVMSGTPTNHVQAPADGNSGSGSVLKLSILFYFNVYM